MQRYTLRTLLLLAIRGYQRYLSPHKGFSCAYRVHTGCASCSVFGYRAIRRYGSAAGLIVLRRRLALCGDTWRRHHPPHPVNYQAGECVPDCDLGGGDACWGLADCGCCTWSKRRRRR